jgi:hypothetical protein
MIYNRMVFKLRVKLQFTICSTPDEKGLMVSMSPSNLSWRGSRSALAGGCFTVSEAFFYQGLFYVARVENEAEALKFLRLGQWI